MGVDIRDEPEGSGSARPDSDVGVDAAKTRGAVAGNVVVSTRAVPLQQNNREWHRNSRSTGHNPVATRLTTSFGSV
jgi:hypothetical protein